MPSLEVVRRLRTDAGFSDKDPEAVAVALAKTWHGVVLRHEGVPIMCGNCATQGRPPTAATDGW